MANVVKEVILIKANASENNNKWWRAELKEDGSVRCRWGRVGSPKGQEKTFQGGKSYLERKVKEKKKKGYQEASVLPQGSRLEAPSGNHRDLHDVVRKQIRAGTKSEVKQLLANLVKWNVHNITSHTTMTVNYETGNVELPSGLGILTQTAIDDARQLLAQIAKTTTRGKKFTQLINSYLMLVPQEVPRKRGWIASIYSTPEEIAEQENLLDSLEAALVTLSTDNGAKEQKLFDVELDLVTDQKILDRIGRLYRETRRTMHASHSLDMERAYEVRVGHMSQRFKKCKVANVMELWHGTRPGNLLSILKSGLIIPAQASHGRAFGNGVYFSDQSTKALNYASGWWAGRKEANAFMFLADVKMGKPFVPQRRGLWGGQLPKPGFDSTFAEANRSGVLNNEMIVYDTSQVNLKYLVEFK